MKQMKKILLVGILIVTTFASSNSSFSASEVTKSVIGTTFSDTFEDSRFASCVANSLGKVPTDTVTQSELDTITTLDCAYMDTSNNIKSLSGIDLLTNLESADFNANGISNIDGLASLSKLKILNLTDTQVSDISALSGLTNLETLNLSTTSVTDLSALSGLTNLKDLDLSNDEILNMSGLSGLTNLETLNLSFTFIKDISELSGLTSLTSLDLTNNKISDISGLSGLTNLTTLALSHNQITNVSGLSGLTNLTTLDLSTNQISDISGLSGLTSLTTLNLSRNQISDISELADSIDTFNATDQRIVLGDIHTSKINAPMSKEINGSAGSLTSGTLTYNFTHGETVADNIINLNDNMDTPITFDDNAFDGSIIFTRSNEKPVMTTPGNSEIIEGTDFDLMAGVTASDLEDGDLTSSIIISNPDHFKEHGMAAPGTYKITYTVTDSDGNSVSENITITVIATKPIIKQPGDITITEGDKLDILDKVSVIDTEDGDLTNLIVVSNPDNFKGDGTDAVGSYEITYTVTDSDGNVVSVNRTITVIAKEVVDPTDNGGDDTNSNSNGGDDTNSNSNGGDDTNSNSNGGDDTNSNNSNDSNANNDSNENYIALTGLSSNIAIIVTMLAIGGVAAVSKYLLNRKAN